MVDKLEKYGKKRFYYPLRAIAYTLLIVLAATAIVAIPVGISVRLSAEAAEELASGASQLLKVL